MQGTNKNMIKKDAHAAITRRIHEVYTKKNADYGDSMGELYEKLGDISFLTMVTIKQNRLMSLLDPKSTKAPNYESIDDTILDLANYCIIWLMERELKQNEIEKAFAAKIQEQTIAPTTVPIRKPTSKPVSKPLSVTYDEMGMSIEDAAKELKKSVNKISELMNKGDK